MPPPAPAAQGSCTELCSEGYIQAARLQPPGGPVFCLARDARSQDGLPDQVYCGNHAKQVGAGGISEGGRGTGRAQRLTEVGTLGGAWQADT